MTDRSVTFDVPQDLFEKSLARLRAAGIDEPEALLELALRASAVDTLETIGGSGPVPTALTDVRAARLLELSKLRNEILDDEVVAALFRIMPTTAGSVTRRMQATYEAALQDSLKAHMVANVKVSKPPKESGESPKMRVTFATAAAFSHALKLIAAARLTGEVSTDRVKRSIEFPQKVEVTRGGAKRQFQIAYDVLEIPR